MSIERVRVNISGTSPVTIGGTPGSENRKRLLAAHLTCAADTTVEFYSRGSGDTLLYDFQMKTIATGEGTLPHNARGWVETEAGEAFGIDPGGAAVKGVVVLETQ